MNIIDLGILGIIVISVFFGIYHGLSISLLNITAFIDSWLLSLIFHPFLTKYIMRRFPDLLEKIVFYSEVSSKMSFSDKLLPVSSVTSDQITNIITDSGLPNPFANAIENNVLAQNLEGASTLGQYFDYSIGNVLINLLSFVLLFLALQIVFKIVISLTKNLTVMPVLKKYDSVAAGILGSTRGIFFLFVIFSFVPLLYLFAPGDFITKFFDGSKIINFFLDKNFFTLYIKGTL